jgi:hypothetical protein
MPQSACESVGGGEFSPYQRALTRLQADCAPVDPALAKDVLHADLARRAGEQAYLADYVRWTTSADSLRRRVMVSGVASRGGNDECESGSAAGCLRHGDLAAVRVRNLSNECQTDAVALTISGGGVRLSV